eukprot:TRINITY_DN3027_c0_g1_i1.p1 TRINITY_DN3027_c0_g1~~TRINITY_DN3027_c0_g1_i1.p1  ORF type:complete len:614 (+),score=154.91 TRINITY_DN3027_c0_g1_i1:298-2139(+)
MQGVTSFRVRIHNFKARDLNLGTNNNGQLSPFLKCNFDNFKIFKTDILRKEVSPSWDLDLQFVYETRYPDKLGSKQFVVECFSYTVLGRDVALGSIQVDLHTLATGPVSHDILLRDGGNPCGRILFDLEMEQVSDITATLKEVRIEPDQGGNNCIVVAQTNETYLYYFYSSKENEERTFKSGKCPPSASPSWNEMEQVFMKTTLHELHKEGLKIQHKQSKLIGSDPIIGECKVHFAKYLNTLHTTPHTYVMTFSEVMRSFKDGGAIVGNINGTLVLQGVPIFAQMQGGVHTEVGIEGATPLVEGLQLPKGLIINDTPQTNVLSTLSQEQKNAIAGSLIFPTGAENPSPSQYPINSSNNLNISPSVNSNVNSSVNTNNNDPAANSNISGNATRSVPLPQGWEEMRDANGRSFYVDHNTKTTHWEPPQPNQTSQIIPFSSQIIPPSTSTTNINLSMRSESVNNFNNNLSVSNNFTAPVQNTTVIQAPSPSAPPLPLSPTATLPINPPLPTPQPITASQLFSTPYNAIPKSVLQPSPYTSPPLQQPVYQNPPVQQVQAIQPPIQAYPPQAVPAQPYGYPQYPYPAPQPAVYYPPPPPQQVYTYYAHSHGHGHHHHH